MPLEKNTIRQNATADGNYERYTVSPTRGSISSYNIAGLISKVSEEVATQIAKNCRRRQQY